MPVAPLSVSCTQNKTAPQGGRLESRASHANPRKMSSRVAHQVHILQAWHQPLQLSLDAINLTADGADDTHTCTSNKSITQCRHDQQGRLHETR